MIIAHTHTLSLSLSGYSLYVKISLLWNVSRGQCFFYYASRQLRKKMKKSSYTPTIRESICMDYLENRCRQLKKDDLVDGLSEYELCQLSTSSLRRRRFLACSNTTKSHRYSHKRRFWKVWETSKEDEDVEKRVRLQKCERRSRGVVFYEAASWPFFGQRSRSRRYVFERLVSHKY